MGVINKYKNRSQFDNWVVPRPESGGGGDEASEGQRADAIWFANLQLLMTQALGGATLMRASSLAVDGTNLLYVAFKYIVGSDRDSPVVV